ncbi:N-terminal nucleophile aminohydrolase [Rozella allomycis CSF55]|uniref:Thioredoxin-dependent peroxiredoxin n=1 Tax=Rozella allomycis (strain CSF55) TaxID=988480 RepID=A0A4P9YFA0_ROZAC|nr:N-terminal nucleophile aminohydrolase [Rozella allomycis CSF55]
MSSRYSFSLTTFSPSGKLVQIEYALNAVNAGVTSVGIKVIATEKKTPSILIEDSTIEKVATVCDSIGMVYSGMGPDYRLLVRKSRKSAQEYLNVYKENPPTLQLVREVAAVMQEYTQSGGVRPFGVSLLIAGVDDHHGPTLYQVDPSGSYWAWKASAIGKNMVNAKTFLEKRYAEDMELDDAIHTAILTLKEGFEGHMTAIGDKIPEATFITVDENKENPNSIEILKVFAGKKVVLVAVPGAFTPLCSEKHLPGFVSKYEDLKKKGIDTILFTASNDAFVLYYWAKQHSAHGKVRMLADGNVSFAKAIGMEFDLTAKNMGVRSKRYAMIVDNGVVKYLGVDEGPLDKSSAEAVLANL